VRVIANVEVVEKGPLSNIDTPQRDMSDSSIGLGVDGQPRCDCLVARLLRPDSGNVRSDQQKGVRFRCGMKLVVFGLFLQTRYVALASVCRLGQN
jgi:hypothetical protein